MRTPELRYSAKNGPKKGELISSMMKEKDEPSFKSKLWIEVHHKGIKKAAPFQPRGKFNRTLKQIVSADPHAGLPGSYQSIEAGISTKPPKKYCDFHGFTGKYTCPKTGLRFCDSVEGGDYTRTNF